MSVTVQPLIYEAAAGGGKRASLPVMEVFGPTVQGEGPDAGLAVSFVRLGYCDYRCSWCDSLHAVEPAEVREHAVRMTPGSVLAALENDDARRRSRHVVLSGGNPAVHDCGPLVAKLAGAGWRVHVETQGSIWRDWLSHVYRLVVSPKPPSSQMASVDRVRRAHRFVERASAGRPLVHGVLKVVAFDDADFAWAVNFAAQHPTWPLYLSAGTTPAAELRERWMRSDGEVFEDVLRRDFAQRWTWLAERVAQLGDERVRALPQLHVLAWGHQRCR